MPPPPPKSKTSAPSKRFNLRQEKCTRISPVRKCDECKEKALVTGTRLICKSDTIIMTNTELPGHSEGPQIEQLKKIAESYLEIPYFKVQLESLLKKNPISLIEVVKLLANMISFTVKVGGGYGAGFLKDQIREYSSSEKWVERNMNSTIRARISFHRDEKIDPDFNNLWDQMTLSDCKLASFVFMALVTKISTDHNLKIVAEILPRGGYHPSVVISSNDDNKVDRLAIIDFLGSEGFDFALMRMYLPEEDGVTFRVPGKRKNNALRIDVLTRNAKSAAQDKLGLDVEFPLPFSQTAVDIIDELHFKTLTAAQEARENG